MRINESLCGFQGPSFKVLKHMQHLKVVLHWLISQMMSSSTDPISRNNQLQVA